MVNWDENGNFPFSFLSVYLSSLEGEKSLFFLPESSSDPQINKRMLMKKAASRCTGTRVAL